MTSLRIDTESVRSANAVLKSSLSCVDALTSSMASARSAAASLGKVNGNLSGNLSGAGSLISEVSGNVESLVRTVESLASSYEQAESYLTRKASESVSGRNGAAAAGAMGYVTAGGAVFGGAAAASRAAGGMAKSANSKDSKSGGKSGKEKGTGKKKSKKNSLFGWLKDDVEDLNEGISGIRKWCSREGRKIMEGVYDWVDNTSEDVLGKELGSAVSSIIKDEVKSYTDKVEHYEDMVQAVLNPSDLGQVEKGGSAFLDEAGLGFIGDMMHTYEKQQRQLEDAVTAELKRGNYVGAITTGLGGSIVQTGKFAVDAVAKSGRYVAKMMFPQYKVIDKAVDTLGSVLWGEKTSDTVNAALGKVGDSISSGLYKFGHSLK